MLIRVLLNITFYFFLVKVMAQIRDCFVTGKWDPSEDAETLLKQDGKIH